MIVIMNPELYFDLFMAPTHTRLALRARTQRTDARLQAFESPVRCRVVHCVFILAHTHTHTHTNARKVLSSRYGIGMRVEFTIARRICISSATVVARSHPTLVSIREYRQVTRTHTHTRLASVWCSSFFSFLLPSITYRTFTSISFLCFLFQFGFGFSFLLFMQVRLGKEQKKIVAN